MIISLGKINEEWFPHFKSIEMNLIPLNRLIDRLNFSQKKKKEIKKHSATFIIHLLKIQRPKSRCTLLLTQSFKCISGKEIVQLCYPFLWICHSPNSFHFDKLFSHLKQKKLQKNNEKKFIPLSLFWNSKSLDLK
jgi:hypothetical protein